MNVRTSIYNIAKIILDILINYIAGCKLSGAELKAHVQNNIAGIELF